MQNSKRLVLLSLLTVANLASCGGNNGAAYDPNNFLETGDQIVKEKINLTFFAPLHPLHHKDGWNEMKLFKKMEEKTNIHINWQYGSISSYDELRSAQWESKNKPDAFFLWNPIQEVSYYGERGLVHDLTEDIEKYAPNYNAVVAAHEGYDELQRFDDKIYSFLSINDVPRDQTFKQFINKKWLDNLGLSMPTTVEEYAKVLKAFKENDPNGNGIPDEVPLSSAKLNQTRNFLMSAFGFVSTGLEVNGAGKVVYVPETDNYRAYLEYAAKLYKDGLLDNSTFLIDDAGLSAKGDLLGSFDGAAAYLVAGMANDADYVALPPLTSSMNQKKMWLGFNSTVSPSAILVPKSSPYHREIVRWMDFLYSQEGIQLQAFGEEGIDFTWKDEAKTSFTFNVPDNMSIEEFRGTLTPGVGLGQVGYWSKDFVLKEDNEYTGRINKNVEDAGYMDCLKIPMPELVFTNEERNGKAIIETDLEIYASVFEQKVITGKVELDDETWAEHLSSLEKIKVSKLKEITQAAYDRRVK